MRATRCAFLSIAILILTLGPVQAEPIGQNLALDLPYGWVIMSDTLTLPVHIVNDGKEAQLSVFRSEFNGPNVIRNNAELRGSVDRVVQEVILSLPEARLLTSTGFDRTDHAGFILEFVSRDTTANLDLRHRFEGVLFRLDGGNQVLFTLWAKVPKEKYAAAEVDINTMQASFEFTGSKDASVYPPRISPVVVTLGLVIVAAGILFFAYRRRMQSTSTQISTPHEAPRRHSFPPLPH